MNRLFDAHNHLHDARLVPYEQEIVRELEALPIGAAMVNGTHEGDWAAVEAYCARHAWAQPSFGLHPWHAAARSPRWLEHLEELLLRHPRSAVGEIGLDRWVEGHDLPLQMEVFQGQLDLAERLRRPVTIHCVRAWGALFECLRSRAVPPPGGFLLHAYGGPAEMVQGFLDLGAYFSWNPYFLRERKAAVREIFRTLPPERLLVETDAPDMLPPAERAVYRLGAEEQVENHPGHAALAYASLAELRDIAVEELARSVERNFVDLFRRRG